MSDTYGDVDRSSNPLEAVRWQDRVDAWPEVQAYKIRMRERLGRAERVLDVGCGPGGDLAALGPAAVGVDASTTMVAAAARRSATVACADAHDLPFASGRFEGVRTDRVLQHVVDPEAVLDELVRVAAPGASVVLAEPDQETLVIHVPGVPRELTDRLKVLRRDRGYRNGRLASTLPAALVERGLVDVRIDPFPLLLTDPDDAFGLPTWPTHWRVEAGFDDHDLATWDAAIAEARAGAAAGTGAFVYGVTFLVVSATVPAR